jgi:hypothetical protein
MDGKASGCRVDSRAFFWGGSGWRLGSACPPFIGQFFSPPRLFMFMFNRRPSLKGEEAPLNTEHLDVQWLVFSVQWFNVKALNTRY